MTRLNKKTLEMMGKYYPVDTKVELVKMDSVDAPCVGTKGVVKGLDSEGNLEVLWEDGSTVPVRLIKDICKKI